MCEHKGFAAKVDVIRLADVGKFQAEISIGCIDCGKKFQFLGLQPGLDLGGARVSIDGLIAHMAICPEGERPSPLAQMAYGITATN